MYLFCPRNVHVPVFCFLYLERANAAMAMAAPPTWLSHDERPPRAFRKARVLPLKLRSSGCAMRTIARCGNKRNHGAWKWDKNWEKKWWMGFHGDRMGSNETLTDIDGNVQLWVFYKEKHNVMFCSLFIGLEWKHDELFHANCQSTEVRTIVAICLHQRTFFNDTTGYVKPNPTMFLTARKKT